MGCIFEPYPTLSFGAYAAPVNNTFLHSSRNISMFVTFKNVNVARSIIKDDYSVFQSTQKSKSFQVREKWRPIIWYSRVPQKSKSFQVRVKWRQEKIKVIACSFCPAKLLLLDPGNLSSSVFLDKCNFRVTQIRKFRKRPKTFENVQKDTRARKIKSITCYFSIMAIIQVQFSWTSATTE